MVISDLLSGAKSFHKIYNQSIQTAASRHGLSLMDGDVILFLYNNPDYDTAKDISTFRMLAKSGVSASVESLTGLGHCRPQKNPFEADRSSPSCCPGFKADAAGFLRSAEPRNIRGRAADFHRSAKTDDG